ncbi:MAG TPA: hypothetical protein VFW00_09955 [Rhodocyclaceae bacterium]|nr:hypothetical protein [Rhodocyclaceae bacterium]
MEESAVPQEGNRTLGGQRKAVYAKDAQGSIVVVPSAGWEAEEIVTTQAVDALREQAEAARARVLAGVSSPLEFWIYAKRMDVALLAQTSGVWRWRIKRHLRPTIFTQLPILTLNRYANALGISVAELKQLP